MDHKCYLCNHEEFFVVEKRHIVRNMMENDWCSGYIDVAMCQQCGFVQNLPRPTANDLREWYSQDIMFETCQRDVEPPEWYWPNSPAAYRRQKEFLNQFWRFKGSRCLEIGPGDGFFLQLMAEDGADVSAAEPNKLMAKKHRENGFTVYSDLFENVDFDQKFDYVVVRHVLEHTLDPVAFLLKAKECLVENGEIYIEVPNVMEVAAHDIESQFSNHHIWNFSVHTLRYVAERAGFELSICEGLQYPPVVRVIAKKRNLRSEPSLSQLEQAVGETEKALTRYLHQKTVLYERMNKSLNEFIAMNKGKAIYIHGASYHTLELLRMFPELKFEHLLDIAPDKQDKLLMGRFGIIHPDSICVETAAIIISSNVSARDMRKYWEQRGVKQEQVLSFYEDKY